MMKINFKIPYSYINDVQNFLDNLEIQNFSIFECENMGFSQTLDEHGFPVASFFSVDIFNQPENLLQILQNRFTDAIIEMKVEEINNNDWIEQYIANLSRL